MINYTWDVKNVDTYPSHTDNQDPANTESDVVYLVHWRLNGSDDANNDADGNPVTAGVYGSIGLDVSDLSSFTSFADLTAYKDGIDAQIAEKINPSSVSRVIGS